MHLAPHPSLVEQVYDAIVGEIADGTFPPNTRLVQEVLAERYGVSRQPIQQALLLLKSDAIVQDAGRRGLVVAPLDMQIVRDRYQVRASLDALAARLAARRCAASPEIAAQIRRQGEYILQAGFAAVSAGAIRDMIAHDIAFHAFVYDASGNPMIRPTAEIHWRFLRRVMGEVLRKSEPNGIWQQHREILVAITTGATGDAESLILSHIESAATRLAAAAPNGNAAEVKWQHETQL
ncbi:MAG: GntR family transcriptional regulator [Acidobacteriia bacterium]|nr:GntR family transcriptional regulator [Methyloceanibacter sp.]MCL6491271.1 GntR family transcriptional regulator [Terriglobia bacterium]